MVVGIAQAAVNLSTAVTVGAAIGYERQWRQRLAGLRTNTLVALGVDGPSLCHPPPPPSQPQISSSFTTRFAPGIFLLMRLAACMSLLSKTTPCK
jgi:hypothetical protein